MVKYKNVEKLKKALKQKIDNMSSEDLFDMLEINLEELPDFKQNSDLTEN